MTPPVLTDVALGGRYQLLEPLGAGGMAEVYEGWDERLSRPVAIKLLRPDFACHQDLRRRFELEARAAARLSHPNVVAVFDAGEDDGRSYIVMERLRGESLADVIQRGPMDQAWLRRLAEEVLAALAAAHAAGIVHRDVKPANILLANDGRAKVADFGIARVTEGPPCRDGDDPSVHTNAGLVIGTIAYMAPERAMGQPATAESDLYSLGVVLYEALTGVKPFAGGTAAEVANAALQRRARNPAVLRPDADPHLVSVIGRAMNPDPAQRYPTDAAMAADLRRPGPEPTAVFATRGAAEAAAAGMAGAEAEQVGAELAAPVDLVEWMDPAPAVEPAGVVAPALVPAADRGLKSRRPVRQAPTVLTRASRNRRVGAAVAAAAIVVAVVVALVLVHPASNSVASTTTTTGPRPAAASAATTTTAPPALAASPSDPTAVALDAVATSLAGSDSADAGQLATGLRAVAATADPAARTMAAANLLAQAGAWYQQGGLSYSDYVAAGGVLRQAGATGPLASPLPKPPKHKGQGNQD